MADLFFPPVALKSNDLLAIFGRPEWREAEAATDAYIGWREDLVALLPRLGVDALLDLAMYLSFEAKLNDRQIWHALEEAALANMHLMDLKQVN